MVRRMSFFNNRLVWLLGFFILFAIVVCAMVPRSIFGANVHDNFDKVLGLSVKDYDVKKDPKVQKDLEWVEATPDAGIKTFKVDKKYAQSLVSDKNNSYEVSTSGKKTGIWKLPKPYYELGFKDGEPDMKWINPNIYDCYELPQKFKKDMKFEILYKNVSYGYRACASKHCILKFSVVDYTHKQYENKKHPKLKSSYMGDMPHKGNPVISFSKKVRGGMPSITIYNMANFTCKVEFYDEDGKTPIQIASNLTYNDVDGLQGVAVAPIGGDIKNLGFGKNNDLGLKKDGDKYYIRHIVDEGVDKGDWKQQQKASFSIVYDTKGLEFTFCGSARFKNKHASIPSGAVSHFGTANYSFFSFVDNPPQKSVSDSDGLARINGEFQKDIKKNKDKNTINNPLNKENALESPNGKFIYNIFQSLPSKVSSEKRYKKFVIKDTINKHLTINDVKVYGKMVGQEETVDMTSYFNISDYARNNNLKIEAKTESLKDPKFYGKGAGILYNVEVKVYLTDGQKIIHEARRGEHDTLDKLEKAGFFKKDRSSCLWTNKATSELQQFNQEESEIEPQDSNEVETESPIPPVPEKPKKTVSDSDNDRCDGKVFTENSGKDENTTSNGIHSMLGHKWTYDIKTKIDKTPIALQMWKSFNLYDKIDSHLDILSAKVVDKDGKDMSSYYAIKTDGNNVVATAKTDSLKNDQFYKDFINGMNLKIEVQMNQELAKNWLKEIDGRKSSEKQFSGKISKELIKAGLFDASEGHVWLNYKNGQNDTAGFTLNAPSFGEFDLNTNSVNTYIPVPSDSEKTGEVNNTGTSPGAPNAPGGVSIDGKLVKSGDELTYNIERVNTEAGTRTMIITDVIPKHTTLVEGSITGGGKYEPGTRTITWTVKDVKRGEKARVSFRVKVDDHDVGVVWKDDKGDIIDIDKLTKDLLNVNNVTNPSPLVATPEFPMGANSVTSRFMPSPVKSVSDKDEKNVKENTIRGFDETFNYRVAQTVPENNAVDYKEFEIRDTLCKFVKANKVWVTNENGKDVSNIFTIDKAGQVVSVKAKPEVLRERTFYGATYIVNIEASLKEGISKKDLEKEGFITSSEVADLPNKAQTIINGGISNSNTVHTLLNTTPTIGVIKKSDKDAYEVNDTAHYTINVKEKEKGLVGEHLMIKDSFNFKKNGLKAGDLEIKKDSIKIIWNGADITKDCDIKFGSDKASYEIDTKKDITDKDNVLVEYDVVFKSKSLSKKSLINDAFVKCDNCTAFDTTTSKVHTSDGMDIVKWSNPVNGSAVKQEQDIEYFVKVINTTNKNKSNVLVRDKIPGLTTFVSSKDGVVMRFSDGDYFTAVISELKPRESKTVSFIVKVDKNTKESDVVKNIAGVRDSKEDHITKKSFTKAFTNTNIVNHPLSPWIHTNHKIKVFGDAKLVVLKTLKEKKFKKGDDLHYTVKVISKDDKIPAKNVVISDTIKTKGLSHTKGHIKVVFKDGKDGKETDVTKNVKIKIEDNRFIIDTGMNLSAGQSFIVTYTVKAKTDGEFIKNEATSKADNTPEQKDDHKVDLKKKPMPNPKTGDINMMAFIALFALLSVGGVSTYLIRRKRMKDK